MNNNAPDLPALTSVTLPDGSAWSFNLRNLYIDTQFAVSASQCRRDATGTRPLATGTITHPSGLVGSFTVQSTPRGRSHVPFNCEQPNSTGSWLLYPNYYETAALVSKQFSGAGMPTRTWSYTYSPPNDSFDGDCSISGTSCVSCDTTTCNAEVYTDETDPSGSTTRSTFSNRFGSMESLLLRTEKYEGSVGTTSLVRSQVNAYADPGSGPWPDRIGDDLMIGVNHDQLEQLSPLDARVITQNSDTYTWQAEAFNAYAQATKIKRSNSIAGQSAVEELASYYNDTNLWVLGLPLQTDNLTAAQTVNRYVYDTGTDTLSRRYRYCTDLISDPDPTHDAFPACHPVMDYTFYTMATQEPGTQEAGQLASFTDADGHTTSLSNYKRGIPQLVTYPDNATQSLVVDDFGQIGSFTDQVGHTTSYKYDAAGRVKEVDYPQGGSIAWNKTTIFMEPVEYAEHGIGAKHWRCTVSTGDVRQVTYFNAMWQPVLRERYDTMRSDSHTTSASAYNWRGQTMFTSYPAAGSLSVPANLGQPSCDAAASELCKGTTTSFDALGRVTQVAQDSEQGALTTTTLYLSGARKQVTDPKGSVTTTSYQVFDQPNYDAVIQVQAPEGITQVIARNVYGEPTSITQSGVYNGATDTVTKRLYYDDQHRLCRTSEPESGSTVVDYDAANNIAWSAAGQTITGTDCGRTQVAAADKTTRSYDEMNRVLSIDYPSGTEDTVYTYYPTGKVHTAVSGIAAWTYTYNNRNALTDESLSVDGYSWPLHYNHDVNGSLEEMVYPDGTRLDYAPDALGRPTKAGTAATQVSYLPDGSVEHFVLPSGAEYLAHKNDRHLLDNLTYAKSDGTFVYSQDMSYDANANLTGTTDLTSSGTRTKTFDYDGLNRLTRAEADGLWGVETYQYDAFNNIREMSSDGLVRTYNYDAQNRLTNITTPTGTLHSFGYDPQGNTTTRDSDALVFDKANRLQQVVGKDTYAYDASGRRVKKSAADGTVTYYAYNSAGQLMVQYDGAGQQHTDYLYLGKQLVGKTGLGPGDPLLNPPAISFDANPNNGSYTVSWTGETGVSYALQEKFGAGIWNAVYSGSAQSRAFTGKASGTYFYRVRECDGDCGDWGASVALGVTPAQAAITVPDTLQNGAFTVSWSTPASTTSFDVEEQVDGGSWTRIVDGDMTTSISRPATANGSYAYRVEANNAYGTRGWKTSGTVTVLHAPSTAPTLTAPSVSSTGNYTVSWGNVNTAGTYTLEQQVNGGTWSEVYSGSGTSKAFSGKTNGSDYGYRVQAVNAGGDGPWSGTKATHIAIPPPVPTNVKAIDDFPNPKKETLTVTWSGVSGASSYKIKQEDTGTVVYTGTSTSVVVESVDVPAPILHTYAVQSCNAYACSSWVHAPNAPAAPSYAPSLSAPSGSSNGSYTVSWGTVQGATSYTLQQKVNSGSWSTAYTGSAKSKSYSGKADGSYSYRVKACNGTGCSSWSSTKTVVVAKPPPAPTNARVIDDIGWKYETYTAAWNASAGATSYQAKRNDTGASTYNGSNTSYMIAHLLVGGIPPYQSFSVRACNAVGCSSWVVGN
jgi:YD repeat-containing protein